MTDNAGAWHRNEARICAKSPEEVDELYTKTIDAYEDDMMNQLRTGTLKDNLVKKTIANMRNEESALLLDLASGTGIIAERLLMYGYKGRMDAVEPNAAMMEKAKEKGIYRNYYSFKITSDDPLPVEDGSYDAITMAGALCPNHVEPGSIKQAVKCLKPGGVIGFYAHNHLQQRAEFEQEDPECIEEVEGVLRDLVHSGQMTPIEVKQVPLFDVDIITEKADAMLYMYRKL